MKKFNFIILKNGHHILEMSLHYLAKSKNVIFQQQLQLQ